MITMTIVCAFSRIPAPACTQCCGVFWFGGDGKSEAELNNKPGLQPTDGHSSGYQRGVVKTVLTNLTPQPIDIKPPAFWRGGPHCSLDNLTCILIYRLWTEEEIPCEKQNIDPSPRQSWWMNRKDLIADKRCASSPCVQCGVTDLGDLFCGGAAFFQTRPCPSRVRVNAGEKTTIVFSLRPWACAIDPHLRLSCGPILKQTSETAACS